MSLPGVFCLSCTACLLFKFELVASIKVRRHHIFFKKNLNFMLHWKKSEGQGTPVPSSPSAGSGWLEMTSTRTPAGQVLFLCSFLHLPTSLIHFRDLTLKALEFGIPDVGEEHS